MNRLKVKDIPAVRAVLLAEQGGKCAICEVVIEGDIRACLDHSHKTGRVRRVLCNNCNGIEGKIYNLCNRGKRKFTPEEYLTRVEDYWHRQDYLGEENNAPFHPTHRTEDEKRLRLNKRRRKRYKAKKGS